MFHNLSGYDAHLFIKELRRKFNRGDIGIIAENKEKYINVKINVKLAGVRNEEGKEICKNIQLRFIDSCRFMASSFDKLSSNLCGTSGIQYDKCKDNMELINISSDYIASLRCERCRIKKTKTLDEDDLKKNSKHTSRSLEAEKFRLIIRKGICLYGYMNNLEQFEETLLPSKDALYSRLNLKSISDQDYEHAKQVWNITE